MLEGLGATTLNAQFFSTLSEVADSDISSFYPHQSSWHALQLRMNFMEKHIPFLSLELGTKREALSRCKLRIC